MSESEDHSSSICNRELFRSFIFSKDVFNSFCKTSFSTVCCPECSTCIQLDWKANRYFEVFCHFLFWLRKKRVNRITRQRRGSHLNNSNFQKRFSWVMVQILSLIIDRDRAGFLSSEFSSQLISYTVSDAVHMPMHTDQCTTTLRMNNKENTEKISHSLWSQVTWQYERDRNYVCMDMSYWGRHLFAYILNLTSRHSLLFKNDLHMNIGGIRVTPASLLATFCRPGVPEGKTLVLSDGSALLEGQSSSAGIQVLSKWATSACGCKAYPTVFWNLKVTEFGSLLWWGRQWV